MLNSRGHRAGVGPMDPWAVGAQASFDGQQWQVAKPVVGRSARRLVGGQVFVPARCWPLVRSLFP